MRIEKIGREDWKVLSAHAHLSCFGEQKPAYFDRIDYALLAIDEKRDEPMGYVTVREIDYQTAYWQFGGAFPTIKQTLQVYTTYLAALKWMSSRYKRIYTYIENTNTTMLRIAMKAGFRIVGIRCFEMPLVLEHLIEFSEEK